jgi:hypothetical protein
MPGYAFDPTDKNNLARLLLTIVLESGGELRVKAPDYDKLDRGRLLIIDFDRETSEIVIRSTSDFGKAVLVQPEASGWTTPQNQSPQSRAEAAAQSGVRVRVMRTDEELAEYEAQRGRESTLAREAAEGNLPRTPFRVASERE